MFRNIHPPTQCHIPKELRPQLHRCESLKLTQNLPQLSNWKHRERRMEENGMPKLIKA